MSDWRAYVEAWPWRRALRVYLKDGTVRQDTCGHAASVASTWTTAPS
jgi:predicted RecA/RadA family phage recombinase